MAVQVNYTFEKHLRILVPLLMTNSADLNGDRTKIWLE